MGANAPTLKQRVADLERDVDELRTLVGSQPGEPNSKAWLDTVGKFKNDELFASIMRQGREYRESLRPTQGE